MGSSSIRRAPRCWNAAEPARPDSTARRAVHCRRHRSSPRASLNPPPSPSPSRDKTPRRPESALTSRPATGATRLHPAPPSPAGMPLPRTPVRDQSPHLRPQRFPMNRGLYSRPIRPHATAYEAPFLQVQTPAYVAPKNASAPETLLFPPRQKLTPRSTLYRRRSRKPHFMLQCSMERTHARVSRFFIFRVNLKLPTGFSRPGRGEQAPAKHHMPKQGGPIFGAIAGYTQRHGSVPTALP
jgi:hypothetical protein